MGRAITRRAVTTVATRLDTNLAVESLLAADIGSLWTKVVLLERIGGEFRLVARGQALTTPASDADLQPDSHGAGAVGAAPGLGGVLDGVAAATGEIERVTGRRLLAGGKLITPSDSGEAVDGFTATSSAAAPLAVVVAGLSRDMSVQAALAAAACTYCDVRAVLVAGAAPAQDSGRRWSGLGQGGLAGVVSGLPALAPDAILIAGGVDGAAASPLADLARAILAAQAGSPGDLTVIFAGSRTARQEIVDILGSRVNLRVVDNLAPAPGVQDVGPATAELESLYRHRKVGCLPGTGALAAWGAAPLASSASALADVLRFLARQYRVSVLGVDVGAEHAVWVLAGGDALEQVVRVGMGTGSAGANVLKSAGVDAIARWLPFEARGPQVEDYVLNRQARPWTVPETMREVWLEQAVAREALRSLDGRGRRANLIVGSGGVLAHAWYPGQAALMLLDGLEPWGVVRLAVDSANMLPALGAVARSHPQAAGEVVAADGLAHLGMAICPKGHAQEGRLALRVKVQYSGGQSFQVEVPAGALERIALEPGRPVHLELLPAAQLDVGLGPGQGAALDVEAEGLGLLIDCRGRPLALPAGPAGRRERVQEWAKSVGAWE